MFRASWDNFLRSITRAIVNKNDGKRKIVFLTLFCDFQKVSFVFSPPGMTFCALSSGHGPRGLGFQGLVNLWRPRAVLGHAKSLKNHWFLSFFKKNGADARVLRSTFSFCDERLC